MHRMPLGLSQGIVAFLLGRRSNLHLHKARWHASNAPGFIPGDRYLHARAKVKPPLGEAPAEPLRRKLGRSLALPFSLSLVGSKSDILLFT